MILNLTPEQRSALHASDGGPIQLRDEETSAIYVVIDEATHRRAMEALREQEDLNAVREGIADMRAGRVVSLDEADRRIREEFGFPPRKA